MPVGIGGDHQRAFENLVDGSLRDREDADSMVLQNVELRTVYVVARQRQVYAVGEAPMPLCLHRALTPVGDLGLDGDDMLRYRDEAVHLGDMTRGYALRVSRSLEETDQRPSYI